MQSAFTYRDTAPVLILNTTLYLINFVSFLFFLLNLWLLLTFLLTLYICSLNISRRPPKRHISQPPADSTDCVQVCRDSF